MIIRAQFPDLEEERLQVYAFAPPPVLDHDSAIAAAPFVTSIVHNADMIPRCSLFNLAITLRGLKCIHEKLRERGLNPTGPKTTTRFIKHLFSSVSDSGGDNGSGSDSEAEEVSKETKSEEAEDVSPSSGDSKSSSSSGWLAPSGPS